MKRHFLFIAPLALALGLSACATPATDTPAIDTTSGVATTAESGIDPTSGAGTTDGTLSGTATVVGTEDTMSGTATTDDMMSATTEATSGSSTDATTEATTDATSGTSTDTTTEATTEATSDASGGGATTSTESLLDVAEADGRFTTLLTAIDAAGLRETLEEAGPYTIFAPTDEAFAALPAETLEALLADPAQLRDILLYHVVDGSVLAADLSSQTEVTTLQGSTITVGGDSMEVLLNGNAEVITADLETSNGVIHVIDAVLLPNS
jgi:uncharacterized surface protein with fasciclin (FAS1) repeats